jgi:hypothetical protein
MDKVCLHVWNDWKCPDPAFASHDATSFDDACVHYGLLPYRPNLFKDDTPGFDES